MSPSAQKCLSLQVTIGLIKSKSEEEREREKRERRVEEAMREKKS